MKLGFEESQTEYTSGSQKARAWTERWVADWMYCPNCGNERLNQFPANLPVADFFCATCQEQYELKSQKTAFGAKIANGAYDRKQERLLSDSNPNFFLLQYDLDQKGVKSVCVVPKHFFVPEIIERRKPLARTARRAGWIGSNILLSHIPEVGRIFYVRNGKLEPKEAVLANWQRTLFLREEKGESRGWLIEVMRCVELIGKDSFDIDDVYAFEERLQAIYPENRHVKPKIRQQLQVLRDKGFLDFVSRGQYRLRAP
jgi:type II restriction enzyme